MFQTWLKISGKESNMCALGRVSPIGRKIQEVEILLVAKSRGPNSNALA